MTACVVQLWRWKRSCPWPSGCEETCEYSDAHVDFRDSPLDWSVLMQPSAYRQWVRKLGLEQRVVRDRGGRVSPSVCPNQTAFDLQTSALDPVPNAMMSCVWGCAADDHATVADHDGDERIRQPYGSWHSHGSTVPCTPSKGFVIRFADGRVVLVQHRREFAALFGRVASAAEALAVALALSWGEAVRTPRAVPWYRYHVDRVVGTDVVESVDAYHVNLYSFGAADSCTGAPSLFQHDVHIVRVTGAVREVVTRIADPCAKCGHPIPSRKVIDIDR